MTLTVKKRLNGVELHQPENGVILSTATSHHAEASVRESMLTIPRAHGVKRTGRGPLYEAPTVALEWWLLGNEAHIRTRRAILFGLLQRHDLTYQHVTGSLVQETPASLVNVSEPETWVAERGMRFTARVRLDGVFLRDETAVDTGDRAPGSYGLPTWSCSAPIPDPVVRYTGAVTSVSVTDTAYGEGVSWQGSVAGGSYLYLDPANWRAWVTTNASAWTFTGTDVTAGMSRPGVGRLQLRPFGEARTVHFVNVGGTVRIRAKGAWL